jgi:hypothetical protein
MEIRMGQRTSSHLLAAISETISVVAEAEVEQPTRLLEYNLFRIRIHLLFLLRYMRPLYVTNRKINKNQQKTKTLFGG